MEINKKVSLIFVILLISIVAILSAIRIYEINKKYPNPEMISYDIGEEIDGGDVSINVTKTELLNGEQIKEIVPNYTEQVKDKNGKNIKENQALYLLVHMKLINNSDKEQSMQVAKFVAESKAWSNGIHGELFQKLNNKHKSPVNIKIDSKSEQEIIIPYVMYNFQFSDKSWKNIKNRQFELVLARYPYKHIIIL